MTVADLIELLQQCQEPTREVVIRVLIGDGYGHLDIADVTFSERDQHVVIEAER